MNSIQHEIARLIVTVENAVATDVDITREINGRGDSRLNNDLPLSANRNVAGHINFDIGLAAVRVSSDGERFVSRH